jgi:hypothetical protein
VTAGSPAALSGSGDPRVAPYLIRYGSVALPISGAVAWWLLGYGFAVSLTVTGAAVIVHLLWLERLLAAVMTGSSPRLRRRDALKFFGQIGLLVALTLAAWLWPAFSPAGCAAGVTLAMAILVAGALRIRI